MTTNRQSGKPGTTNRQSGKPGNASRPAKQQLTKQRADQARPAEQERPTPPRSIVLAVWLMYAGAVLTAIGVVISVVIIAFNAASIRASHKHATLAQVHATQKVLIVVAIVEGLIEVAAWLFVARANRSGLKWARIVASALLVLSTWNLMAHLLGHVALTNLVYTILVWLAGLGAVVFLWQRDSSAYFASA